MNHAHLPKRATFHSSQLLQNIEDRRFVAAVTFLANQSVHDYDTRRRFVVVRLHSSVGSNPFLRQDAPAKGSFFSCLAVFLLRHTRARLSDRLAARPLRDLRRKCSISRCGGHGFHGGTGDWESRRRPSLRTISQARHTDLRYRRTWRRRVRSQFLAHFSLGCRLYGGLKSYFDHFLQLSFAIRSN